MFQYFSGHFFIIHVFVTPLFVLFVSYARIPWLGRPLPGEPRLESALGEKWPSATYCPSTHGLLDWSSFRIIIVFLAIGSSYGVHI